MDVYAALAEPNRRRIIELIAKKGSLTSTDISEEFSITPPAISQHLKVLRESQLVQVEKVAQRRIYRINADKLSEIEEWIEKLKKVWNARFNRLDDVLKEI